MFPCGFVSKFATVSDVLNIVVKALLYVVGGPVFFYGREGR